MQIILRQQHRKEKKFLVIINAHHLDTWQHRKKWKTLVMINVDNFDTATTVNVDHLDTTASQEEENVCND